MFQIVFGDHELVLPLALDAVAEERLLGLMSAASEPGEQRAKLSRLITDALCTLLDCKIIPPTEKQLAYAISIARELAIAIPPEVLQYREAMATFLSAHAQTYRKRKGRA